MHRSEKWRRAVASLPCVKCGTEGMTQAAHRDQGKGMGIKVDDCLTAALCFRCHQELGEGKMPREEKRQMMDDAILKTLVQLAREGLVRA